MAKITIDLESRSAANLRDCGVGVYATDATTQMLCMVFAVDDGEPQLWLPGDVLCGETAANPPPAIFFSIANDPDHWEVFAHNYDFERTVFGAVLVSRYGFPPLPLQVWNCSQRL